MNTEYSQSSEAQTIDPSLVRMEGIRKSFSGIEVLHGVDFEVRPGEVMGLMGENGAGKSTLMKILAGVYDEWGGKLWINGQSIRFRDPKEAERAGIAVIYQELNLVQELSVAENIFLGREPVRCGLIDRNRMEAASRALLEDLHFSGSVDRAVASLRVGHQQLVEIAKAMSQDARLIIMDEPTSALSETETEVLFDVIGKLRERGVSVVYISHRIGEVFRVADRITVLRDGALVDVRDVGELNRERLIRMMVGRPLDRFFVKESTFDDHIRLKVEHLSRERQTYGGSVELDDISFDVRRGEHFGIAGLLGSGRTELLESLFGMDAEHTGGMVELDGKRVRPSNPEEAIREGLAFITEDRKSSGLVGGMSTEHNLTLACLSRMLSGPVLSAKKERRITGKYIEDLSIDVKDPDAPVETLSGGNQQKVLLAKWLATDPCVLLLDEPTRGIDVGAKHEIYELLSRLSRRGISMLLVSSDMPELLSLCDRILVLREGKRSALFDRSEATQEKILAAAAPEV